MKAAIEQLDPARPKRVEVPLFAIVAGFAAVMALSTIAGFLTAANL
jgi:hypothetical protein